MSFYRSYGVLAFCFVLSACTTHFKTPPDVTNPWIYASADGNHVNAVPSSWRLSARIGVTTSHNSEQATMVWNFAQETHHARIFGPLGMGQVQITWGRHQGVEIIDGDGNHHSGEQAEQLLLETVGWPIPFEALSHWIFATAEAQLDYWYSLNTAGQIIALRQRDWEIRYADFRQYEQQLLPRKIRVRRQQHFERSDPQFVDLKLVVKKWQWMQ